MLNPGLPPLGERLESSPWWPSSFSIIKTLWTQAGCILWSLLQSWHNHYSVVQFPLLVMGVGQVWQKMQCFTESGGVLWHALLLSPTPYPLWPKSPPLLLSPIPIIELICLPVWTPRTIFSKSFFTPPSHSLPLQVGEPPGSSLSWCEGVDVTPFPRKRWLPRKVSEPRHIHCALSFYSLGGTSSFEMNLVWDDSWSEEGLERSRENQGDPSATQPGQLREWSPLVEPLPVHGGYTVS